MAVAIVGAGIMPANFYLHSALVHSRCANHGPCTLPFDYLIDCRDGSLYLMIYAADVLHMLNSLLSI